MNDQQLDNAIQRLTRQIEPERDLWMDIAAALPPRDSASPTRWRWASAAAFLLLGLVGWQLAILPSTSERAATMPSAELMLLQVYEQEKTKQLSRVVAIAEGFDNWQQQVQIWDQAIAQVRQALTFYPDEPQLLAQLQQLYQQQLSFIQQATLQQPLIS